MKTMFRWMALLALLVVGACTNNADDADDGVATITADGISQYIKSLASDELEGRRPFTSGEKKTLDYLEGQFKALGLESGNGTSYLQEVPMVEIVPDADTVMTVKGAKKNIKLSGFKDYVLWSQRTDTLLNWKDEELVFAGFGVVAPEYSWNDYKDLDVKGKIVLVLVNDPGFGGNDTTFFKGNTMTYYGRWTYKFEEAARQGAKGCLVIHNTVPAGYGFWVVQNSWNAPHLYLDPRGKNDYFCEGVGWTSMPATEKLFEASGFDFNEWQSKARQPGFKGFSLKSRISTKIKFKSTYNKSYNAVAKITGSEKPDEFVIYSAHWDHFGIAKPNAAGDSIYNGAVDNAGGVATMLEIAKGFKSMKQKPKRSILFLAVTAEEQGLWGSAYYARNPLYPIDKTVANINIDFTNVIGKMKDVTVIGLGQSELDDYLKTEATKQGRYLAPDPNPVAGMYFRSDHFNFAKVGIPALFVGNGVDHIEKGKEFGNAQEAEYTKNRYHQPTDEFNPNWDLSGAVENAQLLFQIGKRLSFEDAWPQWKPSSEFKSLRQPKK
ncbi:M28 family metallopeptidase [Chryseolinea soli]|nr:M28 family metallopeptidase [Chryseolinea soli]